MSAHVRVLSTGGTIASTATEDGTEPDRTGEELVRSVPGIDEYADLSVEKVAQRPSYDMDLETMAAVVERSQTAADVDGVVVTHGTDTMAESAYFADLTAGEVPLVFTGAQRRPDETSADGLANLVTAVRAAADERLHGTGRAFVAFDERLHAARAVSKAHTSRLDAFVSPDAGAVASKTRSGIQFYRTPAPRESPFEPRVPDSQIRIVSSGAGVPRTPVDNAVASGADGIVVNVTGLGNVTTALGDGIADAIESGVPVVVASRCLGGETAAVCGDGGETLRRHGVGFTGSLSAPKARIELRLTLAQSTDPLARFESR